MSRRAQFIFAAAAAALLIGVLAWVVLRRPAVALGPAASRQVTDMAGRRVALPAEPQRILSLCTSATDTILRLGAAKRLAAIDEYGRVVPGTEQTPVIGKGSAISREQVLAMKIDLAFVWWYQDDAASVLAGLGVPVVRMRSGRAAEVPGMIRLVGECLGRQDAAGALAQSVERFVASATTRPAPAQPRVFLELYGPYKTVGRDTYMNDLLDLAGASNIAADTAGTVLLSAERLVQADPDVILCVGDVTSAGAMASRPGMADLRATRAGRVVAINRCWLVAGAGLPEDVRLLRGLIERLCEGQ